MMRQRSVARFSLAVVLVTGIIDQGFSQRLRVATVNVWSGLDYRMGLSVGEFESEEVRDARFRILTEELRQRGVDVVAVQEANPVCSYSRRLADALGFDEIHQAVNSGLKLFGCGVPTNFNEGIAILAHPRLRLRYQDAIKVSGSFGFHGDALSAHFNETTFALVGRILVDSIPVFLANIHVSTAPPETMNDTIAVWSRLGKITPEDSSASIRRMEERRRGRSEDFRKFIDAFDDKYSDVPVILLGDFNAEPSSAEITTLVREYDYIDVFKPTTKSECTWSPRHNSNTAFSLQTSYANGKQKELDDLLDASYDAVDRRIDYVFVNNFFDENDVVSADVILREPSGGLFASDHFGVIAELDLRTVSNKIEPQFTHFTSISTSSIDGFPILIYDTDVGFGFGGKGFLLNKLGWNESFDVTLFYSLKVERWYRLVLSIPDFELRQGKTYPLAFDFIVDYDKYLEANLFPPGNISDVRRKETYTREPLEVSLIASRGFEPKLVTQVGIRFKWVNNFGFQDSGLVVSIPRSTVGTRKAFSLLANVRYDTRDSYVNPHRGVVLLGEVEAARAGVVSDFDMLRVSMQTQYFTMLFYPPTIFGGRVVLQHVLGNDTPLWAQSTLGGNNTLRGFPIDRFIDRGMMLVNTEVRFPIFWRLKGVLFYDVGRVWKEMGEFNLRSFHSNPGIGLRFVMDTFVVRLDVGFSRETTGLYFNFGHAF